MTRSELEILIQKTLRGLSNYIVTQDVEIAVDTAQRETGWTLPVSGSFKEFWIVERTKRHVYDQLRSGSAHKFKVEQINLQHRFEHYNSLIKTMDRQFEAAMKDNPAEFAGANVYEMFGTKVDAGYAYTETGRDKTLDPDNVVVFTPSNADTQ